MIESNRINNVKKGKLSLGQEKNDEISSRGLTKEQLILTDLKDIAREFIELDKSKNQFSDIILNNLELLDFSEFVDYPKFLIKENSLKQEVVSSNISGLNIVSVDGSSVIKKFMNVDFSFLKVIAVKYRFYNNHAANIKYYPDNFGFNNYSVQGNFTNQGDDAVENKTSMDMNFLEINLLNELIKKQDDIDLIVIDGSIVITPINLLFSKDVEVSIKYDKLLKEYQKLYQSCKERGIILVGSIKDTRTSALTNLLRDSIQLLKPSHVRLSDFIDINYRRIMEYFSDLDLFNRVLKKSERSCIFNCKREIDKIRDTGIKKEIPYYFPLDFYAFYLKSAVYDTPCRIEFFTDESTSLKKASEKADLISSILLPISSLNDRYGLPIPQIEAHRRAVFRNSEINLLFNNLLRNFNRHGLQLLERRRNRRPF
jgi:hypothetical protein